MYGIEPTHMEELRRKQAMRIFFEERLVEFQDLFLAACRGIGLLFEKVEATWPKMKDAVIANKQIIIEGIVALIIVAFLCL